MMAHAHAAMILERMTPLYRERADLVKREALDSLLLLAALRPLDLTP